MKKILAILLTLLTLSSICITGAAAAEPAFRPDAITECVFLNDTAQVAGLGHCAILLIDADGNAVYYSFHNGTAQIPIGAGDLERKLLSAEQTAQVLVDGLIPGDIRGYYFSRMIRFAVTAQEGAAMYAYAETTEFPIYNFAAGVLPIGTQCDTVVQKIMSAGSKKYRYFTFGLPLLSFYTLQWKLEAGDIDYSAYYA